MVDAAGLLSRSQRWAISHALTDAPAGLGRALSHLGECAWTQADYRALLRLLGQPQPAKILRHSQAEISGGRVRALAALPDALLDGRLVHLGLTEPAAILVAEALAAIGRRDGDAAAQAVAHRWAGAESVEALVKMAQVDLEAEVLPPPFAGTERLRPLLTKAAVIDAAMRYRNCLRHQVHWAASGVSAYYEWSEEPRAVVEITRDRLFGWRLDQARLVDNKTVEEPTRAAIVSDLETMGVHVGRALWHIDGALDDLADGDFKVLEDLPVIIGRYFGA